MYVKTCVTCLSTDRRLTKLKKNSKLLSLFKSLIECTVKVVPSKLIYTLCWECMSKLKNISLFQNKARTSIKKLTDIYSKSRIQAKQDLKSLSKLSLSEVYHVDIVGLLVKSEGSEVGGLFPRDYANEQSTIESVDVKFISDYEDVIPSTSLNLTGPTESESFDDFTTSDNEALFKFKIKERNDDILLSNIKSDSDTESASSVEKYIKKENKSIISNKSAGGARKGKAKKVTFMETNFSDAPRTVNLSQIYNDRENILLNGNKSKYNNVTGTHSIHDFYTNYITGCYNKPKKKLHNWSVKKLSDEELVQQREESRRDAEYAGRRHQCHSCIIGFLTDEHYTEHLLKFHDKSLGKIICEVCLRVFGKETVFRKHYYRHFINLVCDECGFRHHSYSSMMRHQRERHPELNNVGARRGRSTTKPRTSKESNDPTITTEQRQHRCECGKMFRTKWGLQSHNRKTHSECRRGHYCEVCKKFYADKYSYRAHIRISKEHRDDVPPRFQCDDCGKGFPTKINLENHISFVHLGIKGFQCEQCDKKYTTKRTLKVHKINNHSSVVPIRNKVCDVCGAAFTTMAILRSHMVRHTGARPYACDQCSSTFGYSGALYTHKKLVHDKHNPKDHRTTKSREQIDDLTSDPTKLNDYANSDNYSEHNQI